MEHEIESACMNLLALQQPIATDLRVIASCLKNYHRCGAGGRPVRRHLRYYPGGGNSAQSNVVNHVAQMLETAGIMFNAMDAFIAQDVELARRVCRWMTR